MNNLIYNSKNMNIGNENKKYLTIEEAVYKGNKKIEYRAERLFVIAKKNRIKKENENKKIEKLFIEGKGNISNFHQYV